MDKILIIDNDKTIYDNLKSHLEKENFGIIIASDGDEAIAKFEALKPDMIILDVAITSADGWQLCRDIKKISPDIPIIFITSKSDIFDKLLGFELGADDYITKPFDIREVIARIKAVHRRSVLANKPPELKELFYDNMHINLTRYTLIINDQLIETPPKELELLYFLASHPNRVYTRDQLLDEVWGFEYYGDSRTIDVHIKRLREKIEGISKKWSIKTVWGVGYKFESEKNE